MNIEPGKYQITMTRAELVRLNRALEELSKMRAKYPNETNGYNADISTTVDGIHHQIRTILNKDI